MSYRLVYANKLYVITFKEKDAFVKQSCPGPKPLNTVTKVGMALPLLASRRALPRVASWTLASSWKAS